MIQITYVRDPASPNFMWRVDPIYNRIEPALRACASDPGLFFKGEDTTSIKKAFRDMAREIRRRQIRLAE
jgi:hypothetical protein